MGCESPTEWAPRDWSAMGLQRIDFPSEWRVLWDSALVCYETRMPASPRVRNPIGVVWLTADTGSIRNHGQTVYGMSALPDTIVLDRNLVETYAGQWVQSHIIRHESLHVIMQGGSDHPNPPFGNGACDA